MDWVEIGRGCKIRHAIIDKANVIPSGTTIGYDREGDRQRYKISPGGVVVLGRGPRKTTRIMNSYARTPPLARQARWNTRPSPGTSHETVYLHSRPLLSAPARESLARSG